MPRTEFGVSGVRVESEFQAGVLGIPLTVSPVPRLRELAQLGVLVVTCFDPDSLLAVVGLNGVDLVVLHAELGGAELASAVRDRTDCPVFLLGSRSEVCSDRGPWVTVDAVLADDAPLAPQLRPWLGDRSRPGGLRWGRMLLDRRTRRAFWEDRELPLTTQQFRVLSRLAEAAGGLVGIDELSRTVYQGHVGADRQRLMAHIRRIRKLIEPDPAHPRFLLTVRGEGFRLADDVELRQTAG